MKGNKQITCRAFSACLSGITTVHLALLLFSCPLQGQVADTASFVNEARQWWDSSFYRYATFIGDMPVEPIWEGAEVAEVPNGTHLIILPIVNGSSIQVSNGWYGTAPQPNGGVRLVLKRFSPTQIYPVLFFVYGYSDYVAANGPGAVFAKNKPQGLDTAFTGEAFYMYPAMFPSDSMKLINGAVIHTGGIGSSSNNSNWSPGGLPVGGSSGPGGTTNEPGGNKVNPKVDSKLCPDGSLRPSSGNCKCPDGSPMPGDGDCGEGNCTLLNVDVVLKGATVSFVGSFPFYTEFSYETFVAGSLTNSQDGNPTFRSLLGTDVIPYTEEIIAQDHLVVESKVYKIPKVWLQNVRQQVTTRSRLLRWQIGQIPGK